MDDVKLFVNILDGHRVAYSSETIFRVQIGKGAKGSYRDRYTIKGNLSQAVILFNGINIGNGYKKRLYSDGMRHPVLARQTS